MTLCHRSFLPVQFFKITIITQPIVTIENDKIAPISIIAKPNPSILILRIKAVPSI